MTDFFSLVSGPVTIDPGLMKFHSVQIIYPVVCNPIRRFVNLSTENLSA